MTDPAAPRKRRVFLWIFLAVQALFVIGLFNAAGHVSSPTDCGTLSAQDCQDAYNAGTGLGITAYMCVWAVFDIVIGGGYAVYRLAKRP